MHQYVVWLKKWFALESGLQEDICEQNYFEIGLIDSLKVIDLIEDIENEFDVGFRHDHFQDPRISSIKGLAEIIQELKKK